MYPHVRISAFPFAAISLFALLSACGGNDSLKADVEDPLPSATELSSPTELPEIVLGPNAPELAQMKISPVQEIPIPADEVTAPAKVEVNPNRVAHAVPPVPGRVVHVLVQLGDSVVEGQPVVTLDSPAVGEAQSAYLQAEASVKQAELNIAQADADLVRISDLYQHEAIAKKEVVAAKTTLDVAKSTRDQAASALEQARRRLDLLGLQTGEFGQQVTVTAPISGKVIEISVVDGETHNDSAAPLLTIADLSRVWVSSDVPESEIRYCHVGGLVTLELIAYPGETFSARVKRIADTVDPETRTVEVTAVLDNKDGRLRPEMFGRVHYADATAPTLWIPESAVVQANGENYVFVEQGTGRFQPTKVALGKRHENGFVVTGGIKDGARVVTQGAVYLKTSL